MCEHCCEANRLAGERGPCKADNIARVYKHRVEVGEESEPVPSNLFYLSGCDLRCVFCIAEANAFDPRRGQHLTADFFHQAIDWGRAQGAHTLEWVGGEPTVHLPANRLANQVAMPMAVQFSTPLFEEGDVLVINLWSTPRPGDVVLYSVRPGGLPFVKVTPTCSSVKCKWARNLK